MIFPGFPGVLSFFQVFQVEWEPWISAAIVMYTEYCNKWPYHGQIAETPKWSSEFPLTLSVINV